MNDLNFRSRVKAAALQYALFIQTQPNNPNSRANWAQRMLQSPDQLAQQLAGGVVMNINVQQAGAGVTDQNLATAVQVVADLQM
ncbi:MAG TPA: hypothetical protein VKD72_14710 [Gemmataceae bacterium]|nr:hypothetical protein [Gemmataceae bacterium]